MAALLFFIPLLVFVFAILSKKLNDLSKALSQLFIVPDKRTENLKILKNELSSICMAEEFPRYARTERKINKLSAEISKSSQDNAQAAFIIKCVVYGVFHVIRVVSFLLLLFSCRYEPVLKLPEDWLFPFGYFLSLPIAQTGCISVIVWIMTCRATVNTAMEVFT